MLSCSNQFIVKAHGSSPTEWKTLGISLSNLCELSAKELILFIRINMSTLNYIRIVQ